MLDSLVGVSEECRWPPEVIGRPVVTAARIDPAAMSSLEIDEAVRASVRDGRSLYRVDADLIDALSPDVIVTQDLCAVCAVSSGELAEACLVDAAVISLDPRTLAEVAETVRLLGSRLGARERGDELAARCCERSKKSLPGSRLAEAPRVLRGVDRPAVLCGTLAAGDDRSGRRGRCARPRRAVVASDDLGASPFPGAGACDRRTVRLRCRSRLRHAPGRSRLRCRGRRGRRGRHYSRPAPRLAEGVRQLAHLIHPNHVADPGFPVINLQRSVV